MSNKGEIADERCLQLAPRTPAALKRTAALNMAFFRINASLVLNTVLGQVVESARPLADTRLNVAATPNAPDKALRAGVAARKSR